MRATVSKQKFNYSFFYLHVLGLGDQFNATKDAVVYLNTFSPQCDSANFRGSCDYSNHLDKNSAWKLLVASCVCVWPKPKWMFSMCSSPALKCSSLARNYLVPSDKCVRVLFGSWFRNAKKRTEPRVKRFPEKKTSFQVGMELKKVQKQGRDEESPEPYPTTE